MASVPTANEKLKVYLINHDPLEHVNQLQKMRALGKFVVEQTIREFRAGAYNDFVLGELFSTEEQAKHKLYPDEYYLELLISSDAISHTIKKDGRVFIKPGFTPKILALKTAANDKTYLYDDKRKSFYQEKEVQALSHSHSTHGNLYQHSAKRYLRVV